MEENKKKVIKALKNKEVDFVTEVKWPFIMDFLKFIKSAKIDKVIKGVKSNKKREMVDYSTYILMYLLKVLTGISSARGTVELLSDSGVMNLLGFKPEQINDGICQRGDANQHGKGFKKKSSHHECAYIK